MSQAVVLKSNKTGMTVILDSRIDFETILEELKAKFKESSSFWGASKMTLTIEGRKLSPEEEMSLVNTIEEYSDIEILCLLDSDYSVVKRSEEAFFKKYMEYNNLTCIMLPGSLREGDKVSYEQSLVIVGDVYEGAEVESDGSVLVLGEIAGSVRAGRHGNADAVIVTYNLNSNDLTIAGSSLELTGNKKPKVKGPAAAMLSDNELVVKSVKKSFLSAINHKKCW